MQWLYGLDRLHRIGSSQVRMRLIEEAVALGAAGFDVAPMYGNGFGECSLGGYLKHRASERDRLLVNTKFGIPYVAYGTWPHVFFSAFRAIDLVSKQIARSECNRDFSAKKLRLSVDESLRRLNTDYIDTLFLHEPLGLIDQPEILVFEIERLKREGKVRKYGVAGEFSCVFEIATRINADVLQVPLSLLQGVHDFTGKLNVYHVRRSLSSASSQAFNLSNYYEAAQQHGAETVLFQSTQTKHLKQFAGA